MATNTDEYLINNELIPINGINKNKITFITTFFTQIESISHLADNVFSNDQTMKYQEIRQNVALFMEQIAEEKEKLLKECGGWLLPAVNEVIQELSDDAEQLQSRLDHALNHAEEISQQDWKADANSWLQLYAKWHDHQELVQKVMTVASMRMHDLIDKDVRMIEDYQTQNLSQLESEGELQDLETRLNMAIREPLKELKGLVKQQGNAASPSVKQATDWIATLQEKREEYSNRILMKIDSIMKEMHLEDAHFMENHSELETEIAFMEYEFKHLEGSLSHSCDDQEIQNIHQHLNDLKEHLDLLTTSRLPKELKDKLQRLNARAKAIFANLEKISN
jgi:hypothetical protein